MMLCGIAGPSHVMMLCGIAGPSHVMMEPGKAIDAAYPMSAGWHMGAGMDTFEVCVEMA